MFDGLVKRQRGVVARWQALAGGYTRSAIEKRLTSGRWQRLANGVYATSPGRLGRLAEFWAAVLAAGSGAMLSHHSAAEILGLTAGGIGPIHVTVPAGRHPQWMPGVVIHRSRRAAWIRHPNRSPPQTRAEETVLDLWEVAADLDEALGWVAVACGRAATSPERLSLALQSRLRVRWRAELMAALRDVETGCRSLLELRYLRDVERAHGLPEGERWPCGSRALREARPPEEVSRGTVLYPAFGTSVHLGDADPEPEEDDADQATIRVVESLRELLPPGAVPAREIDETLQGRVLRYADAEVLERPCDVADQVAATLRRHGWRRHPRRCSPSCGALTP
ncbi:hypothetical protein J2S43_005452 [Catenuloplanes nepalensis]|uniref:Type IV toxin-antitoxin system AbiEi family antitoxin domain-containing protein n=1 Tax=Catenuloplanes nepalensis TaxID=587533 RepID=A0ABT9MZR3_9ACTN|nr:hypothetical protein [Catenuloplanes nepalensis]MDP9796940.1 hypothetical protein [Catenuloplanes nepalensis]